MSSLPKPLIWVGTCLEDLKNFPEDVKQVMGYALHLAQADEKHPDAKPLRGFGGSGVVEIVDEFDGNTYRAVYTVKFAGAVYALHAFQKKSRKGIKTSKADLDLVTRRLKIARDHHAAVSEEARRKEAESNEAKD